MYIILTLAIGIKQIILIILIYSLLSKELNEDQESKHIIEEKIYVMPTHANETVKRA
jgi:hypothetical protein